MPTIGIAVEKQTLFRGVQQPFSNVYYYSRGAVGPTQSEAEALVDEVVALEKTVHSTLVTFRIARLWTETGNVNTNEMLVTKTLSGTGGNAASAALNMDRERAFLVRVRAGKDSRGHPVYLRKWYHLVGTFSGSSVGQQVLENTAELSASERSAGVSFFNNISEIGSGVESWGLTSKTGRARTLPLDTQVHRFLEHHQLGDQWRG